MEITKPILHVGVLKHDIGNISYSADFLKRLADSKSTGLELNAHDGEKIGEVKSLEFKDNALFATMDIPDEHLEDDIAFSTDIAPSKYNKIDSNTFEPVDGVLDNVVYVNDGTPVRDTRTITRLQNLDDKGDVDMGNEDLAQELGALQTKYAQLETENTTLKNDIEKLKNEKSTLETQLGEKTNELNTINEKLNGYKKTEEEQKDDIIKKLVESEDDPLAKVYKEKFTLDELNLIATKEGKVKSTPTKGVGTKVSDQTKGDDPKDDKDEDEFNYQERKKAMGIR